MSRSFCLTPQITEHETLFLMSSAGKKLARLRRAFFIAHYIGNYSIFFYLIFQYLMQV